MRNKISQQELSRVQVDHQPPCRDREYHHNYLNEEQQELADQEQDPKYVNYNDDHIDDTKRNDEPQRRIRNRTTTTATTTMDNIKANRVSDKGWGEAKSTTSRGMGVTSLRGPTATTATQTGSAHTPIYNNSNNNNKVIPPRRRTSLTSSYVFSGGRTSLLVTTRIRKTKSNNASTTPIASPSSKPVHSISTAHRGSFSSSFCQARVLDSTSETIDDDDLVDDDQQDSEGDDEEQVEGQRRLVLLKPTTSGEAFLVQSKRLYYTDDHRIHCNRAAAVSTQRATMTKVLSTPSCLENTNDHYTTSHTSTTPMKSNTTSATSRTIQSTINCDDNQGAITIERPVLLRRRGWGNKKSVVRFDLNSLRQQQQQQLLQQANERHDSYCPHNSIRYRHRHHHHRHPSNKTAGVHSSISKKKKINPPKYHWDDKYLNHDYGGDETERTCTSTNEDDHDDDAVRIVELPHSSNTRMSFSNKRTNLKCIQQPRQQQGRFLCSSYHHIEYDDGDDDQDYDDDINDDDNDDVVVVVDEDDDDLNEGRLWIPVEESLSNWENTKQNFDFILQKESDLQRMMQQLFNHCFQMNGCSTVVPRVIHHVHDQDTPIQPPPTTALNHVLLKFHSTATTSMTQLIEDILQKERILNNDTSTTTTNGSIRGLEMKIIPMMQKRQQYVIHTILEKQKQQKQQQQQQISLLHGNHKNMIGRKNRINHNKHSNNSDQQKKALTKQQQQHHDAYVLSQQYQRLTRYATQWAYIVGQMDQQTTN